MSTTTMVFVGGLITGAYAVGMYLGSRFDSSLVDIALNAGGFAVAWMGLTFYNSRSSDKKPKKPNRHEPEVLR